MKHANKNPALTAAESEILAGYESEGFYYFSDYTSPDLVESKHGVMPKKIKDLWIAYEGKMSELQLELYKLSTRRDANEDKV